MKRILILSLLVLTVGCKSIGDVEPEYFGKFSMDSPNPSTGYCLDISKSKYIVPLTAILNISSSSKMFLSVSTQSILVYEKEISIDVKGKDKFNTYSIYEGSNYLGTYNIDKKTLFLIIDNVNTNLGFKANLLLLFNKTP